MRVFNEGGVVIDETSPGTFKVQVLDSYCPGWSPDPHQVIERICTQRIEDEFRRSLTPGRLAWLKKFWRKFLAGHPRVWKG